MLGGVAAGLATYLDTDPTLVRIAWAILVFVTDGVALVAYVIAWIVVPQEPLTEPVTLGLPEVEPVDPIGPSARVAPTPEASRTTTPSATVRSDGRAGLLVGIGLVLLGLWFLLREYVPDIDWGLLWPLVIVAIGVMVVVASTRRDADR
jgi:phage shock protein C